MQGDGAAPPEQLRVSSRVREDYSFSVYVFAFGRAEKSFWASDGALNY
jgi:hypothetical protein